MQVLASLASLPRRRKLLEQTLQTLRPQVDRIAVYLNGYGTVPDCVRELADEHVLDRDNAGAERKFWWALQWDGLYLSCDDDMQYPPDYAARMREAVLERGRGEIVSAHGRIYRGRPRTVQEVAPGSIGLYHRRVDYSRRINHGGTGVMAWDAAMVKVPRQWPQQNIADMQLAIWAQQQRVPMWLIKHEAYWLYSPIAKDPKGIWCTSRREGHARRNDLLRAHGRSHGWKVFGDDQAA